ncbi:hypothetical protein [Haloferula sp. BvORR071]|uniref:hypothetical protein n=1 Tax=Haloferula sp. BvORR071 TaxID=1396141 RepID=UPI000553D5D3|nr:hypothetical protein [Haloferula sp. BvORR071]
MPWITLSYLPARTEKKRVSLHTQIERKGRLTQQYGFIGIFGPQEERQRVESVRLSAEELRDLEARIAATDFEAISRVHGHEHEGKGIGDEMVLMQWEIELGKGKVHRLSVPIDSLERFQEKRDELRDRPEDEDAALELWRAIDRLALFKLERWYEECVAPKVQASWPPCPACQSSRVAKMIHLFPGDEDEFDTSRFKLDCMVSTDREILPEMPEFHCRDCQHEWGVSEWAKRMLQEYEKIDAMERLTEEGVVMDAVVNEHGWVKCPHCGRRFSIHHDMSWGGERHLSCGVRLRIIPRG